MSGGTLRMLLAVLAAAVPSVAQDAPYSAALDDPANPFDAPVPGFIGPEGIGKARLDDGFGGFSNPRNFVNPIFFRWAREASGYLRADGQSAFGDTALALGPVTGDNFDVVSLGDLTAAQIAGGSPVGKVTLHFTDAPAPNPIRDFPGADFVVFENGPISQSGTGGAGIGGVFGELAYVEVSSDGLTFARFPSVSLTAGAPGQYGTLNPRKIRNLAGKHVNMFGDCWGTPFDLSDLTTHPLVIAGSVNLQDIRFVRVVDVPGNGNFVDSASPTPHPIYDPWVTSGSGGFDLEAVGAISVTTTFEQWQDLHGLAGGLRGPAADPDRDGAPNLAEYAFAMLPLIPDAENLPAAVAAGSSAAAISFRRDVRTTDLTVEVLATSAPNQVWQPIARSTMGGAVQAVGPFAPSLEDASAGPIASIGVIRRARVTTTAPQRFLKVRITLSP